MARLLFLIILYALPSPVVPIHNSSAGVLLCPRVWTSLENGRVSVKPPGPPVEGTILHYSCHAGFILEP